MFFIYQLRVPRLSDADVRFAAIAHRAARLICTTPDFDDLAKSAGLLPHSNPRPSPGQALLAEGEGARYGATDATERAQLRAELDGLVAHLYGLTESEFVHILGSFPLVAEAVKKAAHQAYRDVENGLIR